MAAVVQLMQAYQGPEAFDDPAKIATFMDQLVGALQADLQKAKEEAVQEVALQGGVSEPQPAQPAQ